MSLFHVSLLHLWGCGGGWEKGETGVVAVDRERGAISCSNMYIS